MAKKLCETFILGVITLVAFCTPFLAKTELIVAGLDDAYYVPDYGTFHQYFSYENVTTTSCTNQVENYFYNLNHNFPENISGTCGYIGISMLLSYFDAYYNDDIINDIYTVSSISDNANIYQLESPGINGLFHNHLLSIGDSAGFNNSIYPQQQGVVLNNYLVEVSMINYLNIVSVQTDFDYEVTEFGEIMFNSESRNQSEEHIEQIVEYIDMGIPVLTSFFGFVPNSYVIEMMGHAAIAYDYIVKDNGEYELFYHMGYDQMTRCKMTSEHIVTGYVVMSPYSYINHKCSGSYVINNNEVCPCSFVNHQHNYIRYLSNNNLTHKKICYCGYQINEAHVMKSKPTYSYCSYCNYTTTGGNHAILSKEGEEYD